MYASCKIDEVSIIEELIRSFCNNINPDTVNAKVTLSFPLLVVKKKIT